VYPGNVDRRTVQNSIAWSLDSWRLVEGDTIPIPYFHEDYQMPVVLLENVVTGQRAYFSNFHNPAYASNQKRRAEAKARQVAMVHRLAATGLPVFITGDKKRGTFSNYVRDDSRLVNRITNHFVIRADVTIEPTTLLAR